MKILKIKFLAEPFLAAMTVIYVTLVGFIIFNYFVNPVSIRFFVIF